MTGAHGEPCLHAPHHGSDPGHPWWKRQFQTHLSKAKLSITMVSSGAWGLPREDQRLPGPPRRRLVLHLQQGTCPNEDRWTVTSQKIQLRPLPLCIARRESID